MSRSTEASARCGQRGLTLVEIIIVISIVGVVIGMAIPTYTKIVGSSSKTKGVNDMTTIMTAIDTYKKEHGYLPRSLVELGLDHLRDPWGRPYVYVPLSDTVPAGVSHANGASNGNDGENEGEGAGEEPPSASIISNSSDGSGAHGNSNARSAGTSAAGGTSNTIGTGASGSAGSSANSYSTAGAGNAPIAVPGGPSPANGGPMPTINIGKARKDHNLVPINGDYDLYSVGADGQSAPALTASVSQDDLIRANNGAFVGFARDY